MKRDDLHFNFRKIDGYDKDFNAVISEREAGKTTAMWNKVYLAYKKYGYRTLVIRRRIADITDVYIEDIAEVINKFIDNEDELVKLHYKQAGIKQGIVNVYIVNDKGEEDLFCRVVGLSNPMSRIKSLIVRRLKYIVFDEFICNTKLGEKYLENEAFKFNELYNTFQREAFDEGIRLKCYFMGNPYSTYNPYFADWNVNFDEIKPGCLIIGDTYAIEAYQILPELRNKILERNPLYKFDNSYKEYAFNGVAINDKDILLVQKQPENYSLRFFMKIGEEYVKIFRNNFYDPEAEYNYWIGKSNKKELFKNQSFCFDINDLASGTQMWNNESRMKFEMFKYALGSRLVAFQDIEIAYLVNNLYMTL